MPKEGECFHQKICIQYNKLDSTQGLEKKNTAIYLTTLQLIKLNYTDTMERPSSRLLKIS